MDVISFNEASTANGRITKVIAEPDSNSGLVTVPSVIASGDIVSIPAGRTLVHPNLQVAGTLNIDGTLFIPSGGSVSTTEVDADIITKGGVSVLTTNDVDATPTDGSNNPVSSNGVFDALAGKVSKSGDTMTGNLVFATGTKIQGDFSNATLSSRTAFQTSTVNGATRVEVLPNGTSVFSSIHLRNNSDPTNSSVMAIGASSTDVTIVSSASGTGTYLPIVLQTGGAERLRIDTSGNVLVTGSGGLGYGTGSGGTVTQLTSKSTSVTLNKPSGQIIMHNASLAAGASVTFIVNNSMVLLTDTVVANIDTYSIAAAGLYELTVSHITGSFYVTLKNVTAGARAEAVRFMFNIIKGSAN